MATAKLWWNGSSWSASETYWVDLNTTGSMWCGILVKLQIIAYDDGTVRFYGPLGKTHGSSEFFEGSKNIYVDGTKYVYSDNNRTVDVSGISPTARVYTTGSLSCWMAMGQRYNGGPWSSNHDTTITNPFRTITFNANGGADAPAAWYTTDGAVTLPSNSPTRTGYSFLGWSSDPDAITASYSAGGTANLSGNVTLYAVWKANSYGLTITKPATAAITILRNGTAYSGNTVNHDDVLTITATPSPGYRITSLQVNGTDFVSGSTHTVSGAVAIVADTVAQSSTIATFDSSVNTLDTFSLTVNRYSTSHYNKLRYYDSNNNLLFTSDVFTDSSSLTIPQSWFTNFGSVTSITITAILTTYTEPECINVTGVTETCTFTVTADATMKPTLAAGVITLTPYNTGTGAASLTNPGYVKGYSKVQAVFDTSKITHAVGASAGSYAISVQGVSVSGSSTTLLSSNKVNAAGTLTVTYTVTDSRGRSTTDTQTISVNDYATPAVASLNCYRCDYSGQEDENDPYMAVTPTCTFTPLANNAITIEIFVKPTGGSYTSYGTTPNTQRKIIGGTFLSDSSYYVKVTVTDTVGNSASTEMSMPRRSWIFHMRNSLGGPGAAFGKVAENDLTLQLATGWDFMMGSTSMSEADLQRILSLTPGGSVEDVTVDGVSVVNAGVAEIDLTGKVNDSGDTMTGDLTYKSSNIERDVEVVSSVAGSGIEFTDVNNDVIGTIKPYVFSGSEIFDGVQFQISRDVNGSPVTNVLQMLIDKDGNKYIGLHQAPWLQALGIGAPTIVTTISDVVTAGSGITINEISVTKWGRVCQLYINFKSSSAIGTSSKVIATLKAPYRPMESTAIISTTGNLVGYISSESHELAVTRAAAMTSNVAANTSVAMRATYIV